MKKTIITISLLLFAVLMFANRDSTGIGLTYKIWTNNPYFSKVNTIDVDFGRRLIFPGATVTLGADSILVSGYLTATTGNGLYWAKNGNSFGAESDFGSNDAFGINLETNGTRRLRVFSGGGIYSGTVTDFDLSASDTARFMSTGAGKLTILGNASSNTFLNGANGSILFQGTASYDAGGAVTYTGDSHSFSTGGSRRLTIGFNGIGLNNAATKILGLDGNDTLVYSNSLPVSLLANAADTVIVVNNFGDLTSAIGKNGNLAITDRTGAMYRKDGGTWSTIVMLPNGYRAVDASSTSGTAITPSTSYSRYQLILTGTGTVNNPSSIAGFSDGSVYVIELFNNTSSNKNVSFGTEYLTNGGLQFPTLTIGDSTSMVISFQVMSTVVGKRLVSISPGGGQPILDGGNPASDGFLAIGSHGTFATGFYSDDFDSLRMTIGNSGSFLYELQENAALSAYFNNNGTNYLTLDTDTSQVVLGDDGVALKVLGDLKLSKTIIPVATTGDQTIDKSSGSVNFAAAATSLVVTNSLVTANSIIQLTVATNDTTMKSAAYEATSGSFTIYANAAPTGETKVVFTITN